jgi:hypothetical protein
MATDDCDPDFNLDAADPDRDLVPAVLLALDGRMVDVNGRTDPATGVRATESGTLVLVPELWRVETGFPYWRDDASSEDGDEDDDG